MPIKKKVERIIIDPATPEELEAARKQANVNAEEEPAKEEPKKVVPTSVIFKSIDGRRLQLGIGTNFFEGTTITVPSELADEAERVLTEGHYLITRIN